MTISSNLRGIICIVLAGLLFVACDSFLKLLLADLPPLQTLVLRGIAASLSGLALVFALGMGKDIHRTFGLWTFLRALAEVVSVLAFIFALAHAPLADVTAIYQIAPLIVLAVASFLYGEKVGWLRWLLIAFGFAGALAVAQPGGAQSSPFALLSFITAFASALRDILTRKVPVDLPGPVSTLTVVVTVLAAAMIGTSLFETWVPIKTEHYFYAAAAGVFVMLAHLMIFLAFRFATARAVAPFYYALTVFAAISGAAFFSEYPNTLSLVGIAMIITCGIGVLLLEEKRQV
jgi:drug/metabolite transporter (DMT)-like permease